jgi:hypothetical protein
MEFGCPSFWKLSKSCGAAVFVSCLVGGHNDLIKNMGNALNPPGDRAKRSSASLARAWR